MEALGRKRERLRDELQQAYDAWLRTTGDLAGSSRLPIDVSGCGAGSRTEWFGYLAARDRLITAYTGQSAAA